MPEVLEHRKFSKFDFKAKSNKFWNITLYDDDSVEVHFGPQSKDGQMKTFPAGHKKSGRSGFEKYIREKTSSRKGYIENKVLESVKSDGIITAGKTDLKSKAVADIAKGQPELVSLLEYFAEVNAHNLYQASGGKITYDTSTGMFKTTQGIVTLDQIQTARDFLDNISAFVSKDDFVSDDFYLNVNHYLSLIPQEGLVRQIDFSDMFSASNGMQKQIDILDALATSYAAVLAIPKNKTIKKQDDVPLFRVVLDLVKSKTEFLGLRDLYRKTKGGHRDVAHYDVKKAYKLQIETMSKAFEDNGRKIGNIMRLWHGTKASNMLSILKSGMMIPRSGGSIHITGRLFCDGLYFSDQSTKSIRYATGAWGGSGYNDRKFMFLADVAMGNSHTPKGYCNNYKMPKGYDSCFAKGGISGVQNNEMIVYNLFQVNPIYILEFTPGGK